MYMIIFYAFREKRQVIQRLVSAVICMCLCILCITKPAVLKAEDVAPESLYSRSCALMDGDSGRILFGKEEQAPMANASTTKIMTCILALELGNLDDVATASARASSQPKVHLGMQEGEQFYLRDLLYALMLESYNDCAVAIAELVAGSVEGFAALMNGKAKELGCTDTYFITPNGLDAQDDNSFHHTTAQDLCRIMKYCTWESPKSEEFLIITQTASRSFQSLSGRSFSVTNRNAFLNMMDGVLTGKTGFTTDAGYCYVAALESEGRKYCIALLACGWPNNKTCKWSDAKALFSYGLEQFHYRTPELPERLPEIAIHNGRPEQAMLTDWGKSVSIQPELDIGNALKSEYLMKDSEQITYEVQMERQLTAPVEAEDLVGCVRFYLNEELIAEIPVYAGCAVEEWDFQVLLELLLDRCLFN